MVSIAATDRAPDPVPGVLVMYRPGPALPAEVTTAQQETQKKGDEMNVEAVFERLKQIGGKGDDKTEDR